jgi:hypothetical protein
MNLVKIIPKQILEQFLIIKTNLVEVPEDNSEEVLPMKPVAIRCQTLRVEELKRKFDFYQIY